MSGGTGNGHTGKGSNGKSAASNRGNDMPWADSGPTTVPF